MTNTTKRIVTAATFGVGLLCLATPAVAADSWHGADHAWDTQARYVTVCDNEVDGHQVKARYSRRSESGFDVRETRGQGNCTNGPSRTGDPVLWHQTCENDWTGFWSCGARAYTGY